jgi:hypothetical protein
MVPGCSVRSGHRGPISVAGPVCPSPMTSIPSEGPPGRLPSNQVVHIRLGVPPRYLLFAKCHHRFQRSLRLATHFLCCSLFAVQHGTLPYPETSKIGVPLSVLILQHLASIFTTDNYPPEVHYGYIASFMITNLDTRRRSHFVGGSGQIWHQRVPHAAAPGIARRNPERPSSRRTLSKIPHYKILAISGTWVQYNSFVFWFLRVTSTTRGTCGASPILTCL